MRLASRDCLSGPATGLRRSSSAMWRAAFPPLVAFEGDGPLFLSLITLSRLCQYGIGTSEQRLVHTTTGGNTRPESHSETGIFRSLTLHAPDVYPASPPLLQARLS